MIRFSVALGFMLVICLVGVSCNVYDYNSEQYTNANLNVDIGTDTDANTDIYTNKGGDTAADNDACANDDSYAEADTITVDFYYIVSEGTWYKWSYATETIPVSNISADTIRFMKEYCNIEIDSIWFDGCRIFVNLNERERARLDAGSTAGSVITETLIRTFSSYPNVMELEVLINGIFEEFGNHFNFRNIFIVSDPIYYITIRGTKYSTSLRELDLREMSLCNEEIADLEQMVNLTFLRLSYNQISDLSPLVNLTNLTVLQLNSNQITDLTPLKNLPNLTSLYLFSNQISDWSPVEHIERVGGRP